MRLIDGDAVKERLKNDISGMEERKDKETNLLDRMEILSQLSFARYAYAVSIKEPTIHAITLDRIEEAIDQIGELDSESIEFHEGTNRLGTNEFVCVDEVLEILNKLVEEAGDANE